jgi:cation:H+ antiporter
MKSTGPSRGMHRRHITLILTAFAVALPGLFLRLAGVHAAPPVAAVVSGAAIMGASFLLLWACDAAQSEVSQALALAAVALIAVLPEYSVDMYFTWQAGRNPDGAYAHYAIANMTGANRLLIGVAWGLIAVLCWIRFRRPARIEAERRLELFFLAAATLYAFAIPLKGTLAWYDGLVFLGLYVWYIVLAGRRPATECEAEGPAELLVALPRARRRAAVLGMFVFAGAVILASAEPFCEGLIGTGRLMHLSEFLLVQWLAPVASEAPEFVVAIMFAWRGQSGMALGSLLSAKLNHWTLLVGMIPGVFAASHGTLAHPMPMGSFQMSELLLTAAQSALGIVLLASLELTLGGALLLFVLFAGQFVLPVFSEWFPGLAFGLGSRQIHPVFTVLYIVVAGALALQNPRGLKYLVRGLSGEPAPVCGPDDGGECDDERCATCKFREMALTASRTGREE